MRKLTKIILSAVLSASMLCGAASVQAKDISVTLNGNQIYFDYPPVVRNDRTLVPIRAIFEAMGMSVDWNPQTQKIFASDGYNVVIMAIGAIAMSYGNTTTGSNLTYMDVAPCIINDRTYVPVRYIAESTGYNVSWDEGSKTISITGSKPTPPPAPVYENPNGYAFYADSPDVVDFGKLNNVECTGFEEDYGTYLYSYTCDKSAVSNYLNAISSVGYREEPGSESIFGIIIGNYSRGKSIINITYDKSTKECFITFTKP